MCQIPSIDLLIASIASAGNRTRVNCLEGSYAHHYTTDALDKQGLRLLRGVEARWPRLSGPGPSPGRGTTLPLSTQVYKWVPAN